MEYKDLQQRIRDLSEAECRFVLHYMLGATHTTAHPLVPWMKPDPEPWDILERAVTAAYRHEELV